MSSAEQHPTASVLAEYVEGSLPSDALARTGAHVDDCAGCQDVIGRLNVVSAALRDLPSELPVPGDVSARLLAAVAAERSEQPSEPADAGARDAATVHELHGTGTVAWFRRRAPRALAAAASVAVVGLIGYVAVTSGNDGGMTTADSGASVGGSAGRSEAGPQVAQEDASGSRRSDAGAGSAPDDSSVALGGASVESEVRRVWNERSQLSPGCGSALATELGSTLVGSAEAGSGVLIVVEDETASQLEGHVVSTCGSTSAEELTTPVTIAVPQ